MSKSYLLSTLIISTLLLTACQSGQVTAPANVNNTDRPRISDQTKPVEAVYPILKTSQSGLAGEYKLVSQTSRYLSSDKSSLELNLSNTPSAYCLMQQPKLKDDEQQIRIVIKSKDSNNPITKGEAVGNAKYELTLSKYTKDGEQKLDPKLITSLNITDLNNSVLRGNLKSSSDGKIESFEGEFFTAICR